MYILILLILPLLAFATSPITCPPGTEYFSTQKDGQTTQMCFLLEEGVPYRHGPYQVVDLKGKVIEQATYKKNTLHGIYFTTLKNGERIEQHYLNGALEGIERRWDAKNKLLKQGTWENGRFYGLNNVPLTTQITRYWTRLKIYVSESFNALIKTNYSTPSPWMYTFYPSGKPLFGYNPLTQTTLEWFADGTKKSEHTTTESSKMFRTWYENGQLESETTETELSKAILHWYPSGQRQSEKWFTKGALAKSVQYDESGKKTEQVLYQHDHIKTLTLFHPNGQKKEVSQSKNEVPMGLTRKWDPKGILREKVQYDEKGNIALHERYNIEGYLIKNNVPD